MSGSVDWERTNTYPNPEGFGFVVQRNGQLGYAKQKVIEHEKLGADLAQLVGAPVPPVEISTVKGCDEFFAISQIHSPRSRPLVKKSDLGTSYSAEKRAALSEASGLLPFFAWIGAEDHYDDTNLVVDVLSNESYRITAIDFEHAFRWENGVDKIVLLAPPALMANVNPPLVTACLGTIEALTDTQIRDCCAAVFPTKPGSATHICEILQRRQGLLRAPLRERGWLHS